MVQVAGYQDHKFSQREYTIKYFPGSMYFVSTCAELLFGILKRKKFQMAGLLNYSKATP